MLRGPGTVEAWALGSLRAGDPKPSGRLTELVNLAL